MIHQISPKDLHQFHTLFLFEHFFGKKLTDIFFKEKREELFKALENKLSKNGPGKVLELPRIQERDPAIINAKYIKKGIPVVLEGAARDWECLRKWNWSYLKQNYQKEPVILIDPKGVQDKDIKENFEVIRFGKFIENLEQDNASRRYARFHPLLERHPELLEDLDQDWLNSIRRPDYSTRYQMFLGGDASRTPLHNGLNANIFIQILGEKEWHLYPLSSTPGLNPQVNRAPYKGSEYNPYEPDFSIYPLMKYLNSYKVKLRPGDILWNPPYFWHYVRNFGPTIGIGYRWVSLPLAFKISKLFSTLEFFNLHPPLLWTFFHKKDDFNKFLALHKGVLKELNLVEKKF